MKKFFMIILGILVLLSLVSAISYKTNDYKNLNYKKIFISDGTNYLLNLKNDNSFIGINANTGEVHVSTNTTRNALDITNYEPNGWASIDFDGWDPNKNALQRFLTQGAPGMEKIFRYYRGNNYLNNYDNRGFEIQLVGNPVITVWNTSDVCIDCDKTLMSYDMKAKLNVMGPIYSQSLEGEYENGEAFLCVNNQGIIFAKETPCN